MGYSSSKINFIGQSVTLIRGEWNRSERTLKERKLSQLCIRNKLFELTCQSNQNVHNRLLFRINFEKRKHFWGKIISLHEIKLHLGVLKNLNNTKTDIIRILMFEMNCDIE